MSANTEDKDRELNLLKSHVAQLAEHFDSVHISCTRFDAESEGTVNVHWGEGNWFARYGSVRAWLLKQEQDATGGDDPDEEE
jgi:hypothetical protein